MVVRHQDAGSTRRSWEGGVMGGGSGRGLSFGATIGSGELPLQYEFEAKRSPEQLAGGAEAATMPSGEKNLPMLVKYVGGAAGANLVIGKIYEALAVERDQYRIVDEAGEENLYPQELFEIVTVSKGAAIISG